ncbi:MAG: DUF3892 domain-containing protein [Eubacteriales bacterium]
MTYIDQIRMQNLASSGMLNKIDQWPGADAQTIVAITKRGGEITGYQLSGGRIISKREGIDMAKAGQIRGVGVADNRGEEYLRTLPDESEGNNLSNLPVIEEGINTLS